MGFLIRCPICNGDFNDDRPFTGTSGVAFPPGHPLHAYCDAGLHFDCLESWPHRVEFSKGYFNIWRRNYEQVHNVIRDGGFERSGYERPTIQKWDLTLKKPGPTESLTWEEGIALAAQLEPLLGPQIHGGGERRAREMLIILNAKGVS